MNLTEITETYHDMLLTSIKATYNLMIEHPNSYGVLYIHEDYIQPNLRYVDKGWNDISPDNRKILSAFVIHNTQEDEENLCNIFLRLMHDRLNK